MTFSVKELDYRETPLGDISLRVRREPRLGNIELYEVKLGDEFLMSSLFTEAEEQLATLALDRLSGDSLNIVVGGLGLGYTADAVLNNSRVNSLVVIDVMEAVIEWHQTGLVPLGERIASDSRCALVQGDFFALAGSDAGFHAAQSEGRLEDAILLDIDHSPSHWLNSGNSSFYTPQSLRAMSAKLKPDGIFGLWSNDPPDAEFVRILEQSFARCESHPVVFDNPYSGGESSNTVYLGFKGK
ncbi:MAG: spermidine synthase [Parasphingorhabdus sp.]|jgi:spermidine synthase